MENNAKTNRIIPLLSVLFLGMLVWYSLTGERSPQTSVNNARKAGAAAILPVYSGPEIGAEAYLVKVAGRDQILLERRGWKHMPPASLTKVMTGLVALENLSPFERIFFSADSKKVDERRSPAKIGESFSREDVLRMALIGSNNDAALALADDAGKNSGGGTFAEDLKIFTELMNKKAEDLRMLNSHFENPVGLDGGEHYSTAEDMERLAEYIWFNRPEIWEISRNMEAAVYSDRGSEYKIKNTNRLLEEFPAIWGSKTGYTENAKESLLMLYPLHPDNVAVIVILGSQNREQDGRNIIRWLEGIEL